MTDEIPEQPWWPRDFPGVLLGSATINLDTGEIVEVGAAADSEKARGEERGTRSPRWRVDEWCQRRECWWVIGHHETYRDAEKQLEYCVKNCAGEERRWRVVWLRERIQLQSHKSPIEL